MAFVFGFVFCGVLAYAALRDEPITDPGQLYLLRVLASMSAAGVAAVIPGMLNVEIGQGKILAIRGAGAIAVFVLVFYVNPHELVRPLNESKRSAMEGAYAQGQYEDAVRLADEILRRAPGDPQALNIKGGVAFYRRNYPAAVEYFTQARRAKPDDPLITSNLANAMIETGAYGLAVDLFRKIDDGKVDRSFSLGRAHLYAGELIQARKRLEAVPDHYWHGAARILEATALTLLGEEASTKEQQSLLQAQARKSFERGYAIDRDYWDGIFGGTRDIHMSYTLSVKILGPIHQQAVAGRNKAMVESR